MELKLNLIFSILIITYTFYTFCKTVIAFYIFCICHRWVWVTDKFTCACSMNDNVIKNYDDVLWLWYIFVRKFLDLIQSLQVVMVRKIQLTVLPLREHWQRNLQSRTVSKTLVGLITELMWVSLMSQEAR